MNRHFSELRARAILSLLVLGLCFCVCYYFSNQIYSFISIPILSKLPEQTSIIATRVVSPFMIPIQLSFITALLITAPFLLYQIWMFVKPGLYQQERQRIVKLIIASCLLFYSGIAFALLIICPIALNFFTSSAPDGVIVMLDIADYLDFIVTIAIASGIAFQIPIVTTILIRSKVLSKQQMSAKRKHVIVLAFVLGMLLAPPDVLSQILLAIPMWLLFELGIIFA